jgi:hypothetical protein
MMQPEIVIPITFFATALSALIGVPLARAFARKMDASAQRPQLPAEVTARLERIEHAVESIAVEVERISEGQRFTTKLLGDRAAASGLLSDKK